METGKQKRKIEIADLYTYRLPGNVQAAPGGARAAFTVRTCVEQSNGYESTLWLWENGQTRQLTGLGKESDFFWEDATHLLFPAVRGEEEKKRAAAGEPFTSFYRLDIHGGEALKAFELPLSCGGMQRLDETHWFFVASVDRAHPDAFQMNDEQKQALAKEREENADYHILTDNAYRFNGAGFVENTTDALFVYTPADGTVRRVTSPDEQVSCAEKIGGRIVYATSACLPVSDMYSNIFAYDPATDRREVLYDAHRIGCYAVMQAAGKLLVLGSDFAAYGCNQNPAFYVLENGVLTLLCDPDLAVGSSVGTDCRNGGGKTLLVQGDRVWFIATVESRASLMYLDPRDGRVRTYNAAQGSLDCFDVTDRGEIFGIGLYGQRLPELYRLGAGKEPVQLTHFNDAVLADCDVAVPHRLRIRSGGKRIDGWVLLPRGYDPAKTYPAILDIHGGPKTVYGEVFYHEMQVWASDGYFVFFCNPTGSDGRGNRFMDIRGKYGSVDYRNLMDFTDAVLAAYPQINPARVAVTGGSYGGFMTNWIIGHTDRFACAATQRSISDWFSFYGASDIGILFANDQNAATVLTEEGQRSMWAHSPLKYASRIHTPTLFIHSDEDYRCPIDQGLQLYAALLEQGIDTRFVWFKGENHELSRSGKPKHRVKRLTEITAWIKKYTEPQQT